MGGQDLRDSLHREMIDSRRAWSAEEIARKALKLVSVGAGADRLVHALLGADPRFQSDKSVWHARRTSEPVLQRYAFLLIDAPPAPAPGTLVPLFLRRHDPASPARSEIAEVAPDGSGLEQAAAWFDGRLAVSLSAGPARRALHRLERLHALPAISDRLLDLPAILRGALKGPADALPRAGRPRGGRRYSDAADVPHATPEERLEECRFALETILALRGSATLEQLDRELEHSRTSEPVDFSIYRFGQEILSLLPARPGIYRFIGEGGRLLYVGKSRDLGRRVGSYFRPLSPDHTRRARLLSEIRDLDWETTPSELEALVLEGEAIRRERPPFNQQVAVHDAGEKTSARERDLAFLLCEGDPDEVSVFFIREGKAWGRARLPRATDGEVDSKSHRLAEAWIEGAITPETGVFPVGVEEGLLILRYLKLHRDRLDRIYADELPGVDALAGGLARFALRDRPAWEPWTLRAPSD